MQYYLAIDIGASSGRHVLGWIEDGKLRLEEVYRFENGLQKRDGHLIWDTQRLFAEILTGMKRCGEIGKIPASVGVDTWALDYVLLDEDNQLLGETYGYRDSRTQGMDELVYQHVPEAELYAITGIQKQLFNTIYQLMAVKQQHQEYLKQESGEIFKRLYRGSIRSFVASLYEGDNLSDKDLDELQAFLDEKKGKAGKKR